MCMRLIKNNLEFGYRIYNSDYLRENHEAFVYGAYEAVAKFNHLYGTYFCDNPSTTWHYSKYNVFSLTACLPQFHELYKELNFVINDFITDDTPKWLQSWLNFHKPEEVLNWHDHTFPYHGYISIDPKNSITEFRDYQIVNEIGNIYIGPGNRKHRVTVTEPFEGERITLGFDIATKGFRSENMGFIPLV